MGRTILIGDRLVGEGHPIYFIAEIGINHNGDVNIAKQLMDVAQNAGCDAVKFQKRTPDICVPEEQKSILRETPWGMMTYLDYKKRIEFGQDEFQEIDDYARRLKIHWFASPWDVPSVEFLDTFNPPCHKVASACLTDEELLAALKRARRPVILSTGMSSMEEILKAIGRLDGIPLALAQSTSTYPCKPSELNLRVIQSFAKRFDMPIGYSGHETGLQTTLAAAVLGARFIERHITLDRSMWGTDHAASLEPGGLTHLVRDIRIIEAALGDGSKQVYESEIPVRARLRRK
ncbi:MAG: N-acetylneuraminate synthase family protein [Actinomycetota bacterium]